MKQRVILLLQNTHLQAFFIFLNENQSLKDIFGSFITRCSHTCRKHITKCSLIDSIQQAGPSHKISTASPKIKQKQNQNTP